MIKRLIALAVVVVMVLSLVACGGAATDNQKQASTTETNVTDKAQENTPSAAKVELQLWHYWDVPTMQDILKKTVDDYQAANPNVSIKTSFIPYTEYNQKLLVTAAGGKLPDLLIYGGNDTATFKEAGILADITDKINQSGFFKNIIDGKIAEHTVDGKYYGFPVYANCLTLFYNTDIIKTPPTTWSELIDIAKKVTKGDMYGMAVSAIAGEESSFQWLPFLWSAGADLDTIDSPKAVKSLELWKKLIDDGSMSKEVVNWAQQDVRVAFQTRRAAMMINGPWNIPPLQKEAPDVKWALAKIPRADDGEFASILGGESFGIGKNANVDEIWKFVQFMYEPERYKAILKGLGQLPADKELAKDAYYQNDPINKAFVDQLLVAKPRAYGPKYNEMSKAIQTAIGSALTGGETPEAALKKAAESIKPLLGK